MARSVRWSQRAVRQLDDACQDLSLAFDPQVAASFVRKVLVRSDKLGQCPSWLGSPIQGLEDTSYRQLGIGAYRIIFRANGEQVDILAFLHSRMLIAAHLQRTQALPER